MDEGVIQSLRDALDASPDYTWFAPAIFRRMLDLELATIRRRPGF